jgi:hypothetical protein
MLLKALVLTINFSLFMKLAELMMLHVFSSFLKHKHFVL